MAHVKPFFCIHPKQELAAKIAALPYDVYSSLEAREITEQNPLSFLSIDCPETQFPPDSVIPSGALYQKAADLLWSAIKRGDFLKEEVPCYYIYELTFKGHTQTGLVGCASIDDYQNEIIKKHENTRPEKEQDRICHIDACDAQTGPIFLTYRHHDALTYSIAKGKETRSLFDFIAEDGVSHRVWQICNPHLIQEIQDILDTIPHLYIADGHHRAASAVKVGLARRQAHGGHTTEGEFNSFLSVLFPDNQLQILDYNRVIHDLNGYNSTGFRKALEERFFVSAKTTTPNPPCMQGEWSMYLDGGWYTLRLKSPITAADPVSNLDVSILQDYILHPLLGIEDPKTDRRIQFVGGIRGLTALSELADATGGVAFALYPTSMEELFQVADKGLLMPPKSTWFEPKLRSGLFIHSLDTKGESK